MELANEDALRLNVLLANARAIRIDEQRMCVFGLTPGNEARIELNPSCRDDKYLRMVRELLATHVLGSPRGYPVYLRGWTRMGQMENTRLEPLLMLGESEAAVAVAGAAGLTDELAERVWWCLPTAEVARYMLKRDRVIQGKMGPVLAEYLVEFLPFEEDPNMLIKTISLILQPGLIDDHQRRQIWDKGARKNSYYVGFLQTTPDSLPDLLPARRDFQIFDARLETLAATGNELANLLHRLLSGSGQTFIQAAQTVLKKPINQDVVVALLQAIGNHLSAARTGPGEFPDVATVAQQVDAVFDDAATPAVTLGKQLAELIGSVPELRNEVRAAMILAHAGESLVRPIFARSTAIGSLMRKKIEPVVAPLLEQIAVLRKL